MEISKSSCTVSLAFSSSKTTQIIHKCYLNYEYITVEYRQVSSTFSVCFEDNNSSYHRGVMLSKHGPSRMSRFFHGGFFTVIGMPMYFSHVNAYNTNVENIIPKILTFPQNMTHYSP